MNECNRICSYRILLAVSKGSGYSNWIVLGCYLVVLIGVGIYFAKWEKSTDYFFLDGRRIPFWVAGLSIFGTQLSAITYLVMPAKAYAIDWSLLPLMSLAN